jgi:diguanylate cyclase
VFSMAGIVLAGGLSIIFGVVAMTLAFGKQREVGTLWATLVFGAAVTVVHFSAMSQTVFLSSGLTAPSSMQLGNSQIAIMVMLTVFVICGGFMLVGASFLSSQSLSRKDAVESGQMLLPAVILAPIPDSADDRAKDETGARGPDAVLRVPFQRDGRTNFVSAGTVYALHAEGHYTTAYLDHGPVFCPWSITTAEARLTLKAGFMRVHRSWIVNLALVSAYERAKDHGYCVMAGAQGLERIPVSRNRMAALQKELGF